MRYLVFPAAGQVAVEERPVDATPLSPDELVGPTLCSLVSPGTEGQGQLHGKHFPAEPGYAAVFRIENVGTDVTDLEPGQLVFCSGPHGIGGHRSWQRCPRAAALPLPPGLSPEVAVFARMAGVSMAALTITAARPPEPVAVTGLGLIGHLAAQVLAGCGYPVTAVDPVPARRELLVDRVPGVSVAEALPTDERPFAAVIECSGHEAAALAACRAVRAGGEVILTGIPWQRRSDLTAQELLAAVFRGYVNLRSGWEWQVPRHGEAFRHGSVFANFARALEWLAEGRLRVAGLAHGAAPEEAPTRYAAMATGTEPTLTTCFRWGD